MNKILLSIISFCFIVSGVFAGNADGPVYWGKAYEKVLLQKFWNFSK